MLLSDLRLSPGGEPLALPKLGPSPLLKSEELNIDAAGGGGGGALLGACCGIGAGGVDVAAGPVGGVKAAGAATGAGVLVTASVMADGAALAAVTDCC